MTHSNARNEGQKWRRYASQMLEQLALPPHAKWAFTDWYGMPTPPPARPKAKAPSRTKKMGGWAKSDCKEGATGEVDPKHVDSILDEIELDWQENMGHILPDCPERHQRPRAEVVMAAVQLARRFVTPQGFADALCNPGSIVFLRPPSGHSAETMTNILRAIVASPDLCPGLHRPDARKITEFLGAAAGGKETAFPGLNEKFQQVFDEGRPLVLVGSNLSTVPPILTRALDAEIALPDLNRDVLRVILGHLYPGQIVHQTDIPATLVNADIAALTPAQLTVAARAPDPLGAGTALLRLTHKNKEMATSGLADFPLAADVREPIEQILADLRDWQAGKIAWKDVTSGLLLEGPPGCGKTQLPKLLARDAGFPVFAGSLAKWQSDGARSSDLIQKMRAFFDKAMQASPAIVFIDELDAIGDRDRPHDQNSSWTASIVAGLLECLDGFEGREGVVVIAATNFADKIDAALTRPGRFDHLIKIGQPTPDLLPAAFRWHLEGDLRDVDLASVCARAVGLSGAQIANAVKTARAAARRARRDLAVDDLRTAIERIKPPIAPALGWAVALHECGHAIVGHATGRARPKLLTLFEGGGRADMTHLPSAMRRCDIENDIALLLGGRAAERLILGRPSGGAGGREDSDLALATQRAAGLEMSFGLGESGTVWMGPPSAAVDRLRLDPSLKERVQDHLTRAENAAIKILSENRQTLVAMARLLLDRGSLTGPDLAGFLSGVKLAEMTGEVEGPSLEQCFDCMEIENNSSMSAQIF